MFKISLYTLVLFSLIMVVSCDRPSARHSIHGAWEGEHRGKVLLFKFEDDQKCTLSFKDKVSDSVELLTGRFEIDFTKKPITLSIKNIPQLNHPLHTIIEFTVDNEIRIASFAKRWRLRPITFDSETSMILRHTEE